MTDQAWWDAHLDADQPYAGRALLQRPDDADHNPQIARIHFVLKSRPVATLLENRALLTAFTKNMLSSVRRSQPEPVWMCDFRADARFTVVVLGILIAHPSRLEALIHHSTRGSTTRVYCNKGTHQFTVQNSALHTNLLILYTTIESGYLEVLLKSTLAQCVLEEWMPNVPPTTTGVEALGYLYASMTGGIESFVLPAEPFPVCVAATLICTDPRSAVAQLVHVRQWTVGALKRLIGHSPMEPDLIRQLGITDDPLFNQLFDVRSSQWIRFRVTPTPVLYHFKVELICRQPTGGYSTSTSAALCAAIHRARGTAPIADTPFEALRQMTANKWSNQMIMDQTLPADRSLAQPPSQNPAHVLVRGSQAEGLFHYDRRLPPELKTTVLTKGQMITQEFMERCETKTFIQTLGDPLPNRHLLTPYLSQPILKMGGGGAAVDHISGGIIADHTGTGKTLSILARCLSVPRETTMIIVPDLIMIQWANELEKHTSLKVWENKQFREVNASGAAPTKRARAVPGEHYDAIVLHRTMDIAAHTWDLKQMPRLLLVTHSAVSSAKFRARFGDACVTRLVVDEAHDISNKRLARMALPKRTFTWIVSATPYEGVLNLARLLQLDTLLTFVLRHTVDLEKRDSSALTRIMPMIYRFFTVRNAFDTTRLQVDVIKQYCGTNPAEEKLFAEIRELVTQHVFYAPAKHLSRFFRVLERLGAGGYVNRRLILQVLKRALDPSAHEEVRRPSGGGGGVRMRAPALAFCKASDDCTVCMCPFTSPVQTACRHVYCEPCLRSMFDIGIRRCAFCRSDLSHTWYTPRWEGENEENKSDDEKPGGGGGGKKRSAAQVLDGGDQEEPEVEAVAARAFDADQAAARALEARAIALTDDANVDGKAFREILNGTPDQVAQLVSEVHKQELINLQGKMVELGRQLDEFVRTRAPTDQLVMFTKEQVPASSIVQIIRAHGLSVICAGVMGVRKLASAANIERFRQRQADVLLISNRFCNGFDLFMAREVWLLNTDMSAAKMEQSQGRVTRVSQVHAKVTVRVFVYRNTFDEFLWDFRAQLNSTYTRAHLLLFHYFCARNTAGTTENLAAQLIARLDPTLADKVSGVQPHSVKAGDLSINLDEARARFKTRFSISILEALRLDDAQFDKEFR